MRTVVPIAILAMALALIPIAAAGQARYELVLTPAEADLVFEVRFVAPVGGVVIMNGGGGSTLDPQLRLEIQDPKTHTVLWGFIEHVQPGTAVGKNFDQAMTDLVSEVKRIAG